MKIKIRVKPNSKEQRIDKDKNIYIISLKSSPKNNKANLELLKLLKRYLKKKQE